MSVSLAIFRALADPTRLRIFRLLRAMELAVGEVALVMGQSQPRVSRHLRILAEAGLIERRKEGSWVFLTPAHNVPTAAMLRWFDAVPATDEDALWMDADLARLAAVRAGRVNAAEDYFAQHAEEWDAIRSLHAPEADVEGAMARLLGDAPIGRLVDIGTGTGRILQLFGAAADQVTAIDRSPDMLRVARAKLPAQDSEKYRLLVGDFNALPLADGLADTAVLHQVLHYAQAPSAVVAEVARILAADGRLLIVDFAPHDREELRSEAAHARLGFSDSQMADWFAAAGVEMQSVQTLSGGALTVKLWLGRKPSANILPIRDITGSRG